jgi:hypothetical protein
MGGIKFNLKNTGSNIIYGIGKDTKDSTDKFNK